MMLEFLNFSLLKYIHTTRILYNESKNINYRDVCKNISTDLAYFIKSMILENSISIKLFFI